MKEIYTSATKITLLALITSMIGLTAYGILDTKIFESVVLMVVSFYFGQKTNVPVKLSEALKKEEAPEEPKKKK